MPDFDIWLDQEDLPPGTDWRARLHKDLWSAKALLPVITPSWLASEHCRAELIHFLKRDDVAGRDSTLFPIYLIDADEMNGKARDPVVADVVARLKTPQLCDYRNFFHDLKDHRKDATQRVPAQLLTEIRKQLVPALTTAMKAATASRSTPVQFGGGSTRRVCEAVDYKMPAKSPLNVDVLAGNNIISENRIAVAVSPRRRKLKVSTGERIYRLTLTSCEVWVEADGGIVVDPREPPGTVNLGCNKWQVAVGEGVATEHTVLCEVEARRPTVDVEIKTVVEPGNFALEAHDSVDETTISSVIRLWIARQALECLDPTPDDPDATYKLSRALLRTRQETLP